MFYFDGSHKRQPVQNLGGSSGLSKQTLIENLHSLRKKREEKARKEKATLKIQSLVRQVNRHH